MQRFVASLNIMLLESRDNFITINGNISFFITNKSPLQSVIFETYDFHQQPLFAFLFLTADTLEHNPRNVGPCYHGMVRPRVADGGDGLQIWRVAANILNKQSWASDKGWSPSLGVGRGADNSSQ